MELIRDVYKGMIDWKKRREISSLDGYPHLTVLMLEGARSTGKTFLAKKFGRENYRHYVYINMSLQANQDFLNEFRSSKEYYWLRGTKIWNKMFSDYDPEFVDSPDTLVIIDEIQDSLYFYNDIRSLMECKFHLLVLGSYIGLTEIDEDFFIPSGDLTRMVVKPLAFTEYLKNIGSYDLYMNLDLFGKSDRKDYNIIQKHFDDYLVVGGFPAAANAFLESGSFEEANIILYENYHTFIKECTKYLKKVIDADLFRDICADVPLFMLREKTGNHIDFSRYIKNETSFDYRKVESAIYWLKSCHMLGYCSWDEECGFKRAKSRSRLYYTDIGLSNMLFNGLSEDKGNIDGIIAENFVYLHMDNLSKLPDLLHKDPVFGTYGNGEIDFLHKSRITSKRFGIDAKQGKNPSHTANKLLSDGKIDYILYARNSSIGGYQEGGILTIPIYLIGRFNFDAIY
jgi:predicted AAA+ superfamily ATPase